MDPACLTALRTVSASATWIERCSGAISFMPAIASSMVGKTTYPECPRAFSMMSFRGDAGSSLPSSAFTRSTSASSVVMRTQAASGSCSAWARMSIAMNAGFAVPSAMIPISLGPAGKSISAYSRSIIFAAVTYTLPGPTIFWTGRMLSVPSAIAATAWAPPIR
ncbi:MAG: hypothetical protein A4E39_01189 [Methanoregulaceae archaeon PtaB.Bin152]|nr:MAG: hypothetical protein A4E39_01189 [Methanoregulaceae archaeon PtaB.Bin152]